MKSRERPALEVIHEEEPHWISQAAYPVVTCLLGLTEAGIFLAVKHEHYWLAAPLILAASHLMHGAIIGFHEASHGLLRKNRFWNELDGTIIGILSLTSFSLYRVAHQTHHAHLCTERDEEFWPFVKTGTPRWFRVLAAALELSFGWIVTPLIFLRAFFRTESPIRSRRVRRRIWAELVLIAIVWAGVVTIVAMSDAWRIFIAMYLLPAWIAGNLQSWRKYIEHVGLTGTTVRGSTRNIVSDSVWGKLVSFTLLHEPLHGVHHQRAGLTHAELPLHIGEILPTNASEHEPFASYGHALAHLAHSLRDPRVGPQWLRESSPHPDPAVTFSARA